MVYIYNLYKKNQTFSSSILNFKYITLKLDFICNHQKNSNHLFSPTYFFMNCLRINVCNNNIFQSGKK